MSFFNQLDTIRSHTTYKLCIFYFLAHMCTTKKRDCTIAVPLFEALALPLYPNKQHRAHADMYAHAHTHINTMCTARIYIPRGHQNAAMYWILIENLRDSE